MGLEELSLVVSIISLVVSIISAGLAVASIIQAIILRQRAKNETEQDMSFLMHLMVNSAADPATVRRILDDYNKSGQWRAKVSGRINGAYGLDYVMGGDTLGGQLERRKEGK